LSSAILRRQSDSESCGPETNVPLTFVLYHPDCTPRRSDSFVLTCRGERFCIEFTFKLGRSIAIKRETGRRVGMTASGLGGVLWRVARLPLERGCRHAPRARRQAVAVPWAATVCLLYTKSDKRSHSITALKTGFRGRVAYW
jgi:hypothetical protein